MGGGVIHDWLMMELKWWFASEMGGEMGVPADDAGGD